MLNNTFVRNLRERAQISVSKYVNKLNNIIDPDLREDFKAYGFDKRSFLVILAMAIFFNFFILPFEIYIVSDILAHSLPSYAYLIEFLILIFLTGLIFSCWFYIYMHRYPKYYRFNDINNTIFIVSLHLFVLLRIIRSLSFPCELSRFAEVILGRQCENRFKEFATWDLGALMVIAPIISITILGESRFYLIISSFIFLFVGICFITIMLDRKKMGSMLFIGFIELFLINDLFTQRLKTYFLKRKLIETLIENEKIKQEENAAELRHMIANVAHDLKTPLSSFSSGVDVIEQVLGECEELCQPQMNLLTQLTEKIHSLEEYIVDIRNTNSFMIMTINRCIDYTKATKGMKLVPRYESLDLLETLYLPMNCMKNIQNRMAIHLNPVPESICSHIITDKQWLQENILCLLSNAVKYSSSGEITITVSLTNFKEQNDDTAMPIPEKQFQLRLISPPGSPKFKGKSISSNKVAPQELSMAGYEISTFRPSTDLTDPEGFTTADSSEKASQILFEIEDTGIGMSEEAMNSLYAPFKQNQRLAGGTGLGLYSLSKRIEALSGRYGVRRRKDGKQGSLFWFTIPYKPDEVMASLTKTENNIKLNKMVSFIPNNPTSSFDRGSSHITKSVKASSKAPGLSILVVDDSPSILKMTKLILKRAGHKVLTAENGAIAVGMIEDHYKSSGTAYDAILMDLQMPVMDGLEATRRIRKSEGKLSADDNGSSVTTNNMSIHFNPRQFIIGCSANSDVETTEEAALAGIDCFISKPFKIELFNDIIARYGIQERLLPSMREPSDIPK